MRLGLGTNVFNQAIIVAGPLLLLSRERGLNKILAKYKLFASQIQSQTCFANLHPTAYDIYAFILPLMNNFLHLNISKGCPTLVFSHQLS